MAQFIFIILSLLPKQNAALCVAALLERERTSDSLAAANVSLVPYRREIESVAKKYHVPAPLVAALVQEESAFEPFAVRTEASYLNKKKVIAAARAWSKRHRGIPTAQTELALRASSIGLAQVMGERAREEGFDAVYLSELFLPSNSLGIGAKYLSTLLKKYPRDTLAAISAYNQGTPRRRRGTFENARYVYRVAVAWRIYEKIFESF